MEYTKDLILKVQYSEINTKRCFKPQERTSRFWKRIQKHKIVTTSIGIASTLMVIDGILVMNFIKILALL